MASRMFVRLRIAPLDDRRGVEDGEHEQGEEGDHQEAPRIEAGRRDTSPHGLKRGDRADAHHQEGKPDARGAH